jgi:DNA-directed RNA polymerase specialized sigma24 family protein
LSLDEASGLAAPRQEDLIELDQALRRLEELDARCARVVELRFFVGLTEREAAEVLDISVATLKRDWDFARAWLIAQFCSRQTGQSDRP